ncbi:efflux RND transporter periplasmic adaptor subunit [Sorangium sp. So ce119]|uniref:efflux RND transporter periplasmic adaptor subunit n=1 Tax=Sorangium sp. So ce119 TaxID=3133279 RepID=UPI003F5F8321
MTTPNDLSTDLRSLVISRASPSATSARRRFPTTLLVGAAAAAAVAGAAWALPRVAARAAPRATVEVARVLSESPAGSQGAELTATGYLVPQVVSRIAPKRAAKILQTHIQEGARVEPGQVLFVLDEEEPRRELSLEASKLRAASARVGAARAALGEVEQRLARNEQLVLRGALPAAPHEDDLAHKKTLEQEVAALAAERDVVAEAVALGRLRVRDARLLAPMRGVVVGKPAQPGDMASPDAPIAEIVDLDSLRFEADVPEARVGLVTPGAACTVTLDVYPRRHHRGVVAEVASRMNRSKATGTVKVKLEDAPADLLADMAGRVTCAGQGKEVAAAPPSKSVPAEAVVRRGERDVVFVVEGDRARQVPVVKGPSRGSSVELAAGPEAGAHVIKSPPPSLEDGDRVERGGQ